MSTWLLTGIIFFWTIGQLLSVTADGTWLNENDEETMRAAVSMTHVEVKENIVVGYIKAAHKFMTTLPKMFAWDYSYLEGYEIIKWIVLYPISGAMVFGLVMLFAQVIRGIAVS